MTDATVRAEMSLDPDREHPPLTDTQIRSLLRRRPRFDSLELRSSLCVGCRFGCFGVGCRTDLGCSFCSC
jgi:hypothetical protein